MILATVSNDCDFHPGILASLAGKFRFEKYWDLVYDDGLRLSGIPRDERCLVVIDFSEPRGALSLASVTAGRPQIIAIGVNCDKNPDNLLRLMQAGLRDALPSFSPRELQMSLHRVNAAPGMVGEILADVVAFVPAKPGCGATTLATYATGMAAEMCGQPTLLLDFDIRLGVTTFLLKSEGTRSLSDALQLVQRLDKDIWSNTISRIGNLHLLGSGPTEFSDAFELEQFVMLLDFAVRQYSVVCVDTAGTMEDHECAAIQRATKIFLVCSPDIGSLHLARKKVKWFQDLHLTDKVQVILNRTEWRDALSAKDVERVLQMPVRFVVPCDVKEVAKTVQKGAIPDKASALGKRIANVARELLPHHPEVKRPPAGRRFVEYFSVSPERNTVARDQRV